MPKFQSQPAVTHPGPMTMFEQGVWYKALVKQVEPHLGGGFRINQEVYFRVRADDTGKWYVAVFNGNIATRGLTPEEAAQGLRTKRRWSLRQRKWVVIPQKVENQEELERKYQWELYY